MLQMGLHDKALDILVNKLMDHVAARHYCATFAKVLMFRYSVLGIKYTSTSLIVIYRVKIQKKGRKYTFRYYQRI